MDHPLVRHKVSLLRDRCTPRKAFRELVDEITLLMAYEVLRDLPTEAYKVETPLEPTTGERVPASHITVVPILRAGLGMVEGFRRLVPTLRIGHIGLYREEETLEPVEYYFKIPPQPAEQWFVVADPMLATGGSASAAVDCLRDAGATAIRMMCLVATPEGVHRMETDHPDVPVFAGSLDRELNDDGFVVPGLGDAGDRLFGTR